MDIYFITNTISERSEAISGYFASFDEALSALDSCFNWYRSKSSGEIWKVETGLDKRPVLVYKRD